MPRPDAPRGLGWMIVAQGCFAVMNVCTRLGRRHLPWLSAAGAPSWR